MWLGQRLANIRHNIVIKCWPPVHLDSRRTPGIRRMAPATVAFGRGSPAARGEKAGHSYKEWALTGQQQRLITSQPNLIAVLIPAETPKFCEFSRVLFVDMWRTCFSADAKQLAEIKMCYILSHVAPTSTLQAMRANDALVLSMHIFYCLIHRSTPVLPLSG